MASPGFCQDLSYGGSGPRGMGRRVRLSPPNSAGRGAAQARTSLDRVAEGESHPYVANAD